MNAPEAKNQIVAGIFDSEGDWRWTSGKAMVLLSRRHAQAIARQDLRTRIVAGPASDGLA